MKTLDALTAFKFDDITMEAVNSFTQYTIQAGIILQRMMTKQFRSNSLFALKSKSLWPQRRLVHLSSNYLNDDDRREYKTLLAWWEGKRALG